MVLQAWVENLMATVPWPGIGLNHAIITQHSQTKTGVVGASKGDAIFYPDIGGHLLAVHLCPILVFEPARFGRPLNLGKRAVR